MRRPWVLSDTAETDSTQHDRHIQVLAENGRMGWQAATGYGKRARGNGFLQVQGFDRPEPPGLDSVRPEGRSSHRLRTST
jgi:hypothetical protein